MSEIEKELESVLEEDKIELDEITVKPGDVEKVVPVNDNTVLVPRKFFEKIKAAVSDPAKREVVKRILMKAVKKRRPQTKPVEKSTSMAKEQPTVPNVKTQQLSSSQSNVESQLNYPFRSITLLQHADHVRILHNLAMTVGVPPVVIKGVNDYLQHADTIADEAEKTDRRLVIPVAQSVARVLRWYSNYIQAYMKRVRLPPTAILSKIALEKAYLSRLGLYIEKVRTRMVTAGNQARK